MSDNESITLGSFGGFGVGKTCVTVQYIRHEFLTEHDPTLEDYFEISRKFDDKTITNLTIYDTAGQEQYSSLVPQYMRNAEGIMLVYSATDKKSFEQIQSLYEQVSLAKEMDDLSLVPVILVANKIDLKKQRQVTKEEGQKFADELGIPFLELSAKERINIDEAFEKLVSEVRRTRTLAERARNKVASPSKKGAAGGKKKDCTIQ